MAMYISVPRDLTIVKTKVFFNLTKRQIICFGIGAAIGVPIFFLVKAVAVNISFATMALPPVPNINPTAASSIRKGIIKFTAAKGVLPAKLDTKNPSTTPYTDVNTIIIMEGRVKRSSFL